MRTANLTEVSSLERTDSMQSRYYDSQIANKYLFSLKDGQKIETTSYRNYLRGIPNDFSVDIATMVGCPIRCQFCASAIYPYTRRLSNKEIYDQGALLLSRFFSDDFNRAIFSFQGIGEPSLIPERVTSVARRFLLLTPKAAISISTTGTNLRAFEIWRSSKIPFILQISTTMSAGNKTDTPLILRQPGLIDLIAEAKLCTHTSTISQVKFNYILLDGVNDTDEDVDRLVRLLSGTSIVVKISSLNHTGASRVNSLRQGPLSRAHEMSAILKKNGIDSFVFGAFSETSVSCGQLAFSR